MTQLGKIEDFEELYEESLSKLAAYVLTQKTDKQRFDANHRANHVRINKSYYRACFIDGDDLYLCKHCGALEAANYSAVIKARMAVNKTCFACDHWDAIATLNKPERLVIEGQVYSDGGDAPRANQRYLGFGGHRWTIERDGVVWSTNNLWHGGVIPEEFRDRLPDNTKFVKA